MLNLRTFAVVLAVLLPLGRSPSVSAQGLRGEIIPRHEARRYGLNRAWFTQIQMDRSRSRIAHITYHGDALFVQTNRGMVHAIDAETGRTLWFSQIGRRDHPSMAPAANEKYVAVVNGSRLYVVNREDGQLIWDRQVGSGPGAGPALAQDRVYVPMINGLIEGYLLEEKEKPPWIYASAGRALIQPTTTADSVAWPTDRGYFYVGRSVNPGIRFRVETNDSITSAPAYHKPYFYAASRDGYVYAVHELSGNQRWRFSAGDPISEPPVWIDGRVFVCPDYHGMYCIDAETGDEIWWTPKVARFLGASPTHIYGTDKLGRVFVLDAKNGSRLGTIHVQGLSLMMVNHHTDRIYLGSDSGLLQCLHDVAVEEPIYYSTSPAEDEEPTETAPAEPPEKEKAKPEDKPADDNPFAADNKDDNPFGGGDKKGDDNPFDNGGAKEKEDDPFGGGANKDDDNPFGGGDNKADEKDDDPFN